MKISYLRELGPLATQNFTMSKKANCRLSVQSHLKFQKPQEPL